MNHGVSLPDSFADHWNSQTARTFAMTGKHWSRTEAITLAYILALHSATEAAKELIKVMEISNDLDSEEKKLQFDLSIGFLVVAAVDVCNNRRWSETLQKEIMDGVCQRYITDLEEFSNRDPIGNTVDAEFFVRDASERELFKQYAGLKTEKLPKTSLSALAACLFQKRFLEYQKLHLQDIQTMWRHQDEPRFFYLPLMPEKVYEHWSGRQDKTYDRLKFSTTLNLHLSSLSLALAKQLSDITVNTERDN